MMIRRLISAILLVLLGTVSLSNLEAHEIRPGYLEIKEWATDSYRVLWKGPAAGTMRLKLDPVFPENCAATDSGSTTATPGAIIQRWNIQCEGGLRGQPVAVDGLGSTMTDVLIRVEFLDGTMQTHLLRPSNPAVTIGGSPDVTTAILSYMSLGIEHIVMGIDHLLFVLGLLLIVSDRWMLVKTVTAFTIAHSITLGIATLGYASAPGPPLNAAIALSILFLGPEIVRAWRGQSSLTIRHPWVVAFAFGLLHGFGFASGLTTMGIPTAEIPLALVSFNVGVELGQIFFVVLILALERSFRVLEMRWPRWVELSPGYAVGSLGAFWTIQRTAMLFGVS